MGKDSEKWWKAVGNKLRKLANGIENRVQASNTIKFIKKEEVPAGFTVTYANFVCDQLPLKSEPYRVRLRVGDYRLQYPDDASSPAASFWMKIL